MASVTVEEGAGGIFVAISGDADLTVAEELERALKRCAEESDGVVVDLSGATLLDSRVIGMLLACSERQRLGGGEALTLAGASPDVRRLFTTIGLDREFRFVDAQEPNPHS
jgi:anti-anti-sigma factor